MIKKRSFFFFAAYLNSMTTRHTNRVTEKETRGERSWEKKKKKKRSERHPDARASTSVCLFRSFRGPVPGPNGPVDRSRGGKRRKDHSPPKKKKRGRATRPTLLCWGFPQRHCFRGAKVAPTLPIKIRRKRKKRFCFRKRRENT